MKKLNHLTNRQMHRRQAASLRRRRRRAALLKARSHPRKLAVRSQSEAGLDMTSPHLVASDYRGTNGAPNAQNR